MLSVFFYKDRGERRSGFFTFPSLSPSVSGNTPSPNHSLFAKASKDLNVKAQVSTKSSERMLCYFMPQIKKEEKKAVL